MIEEEIYLLKSPMNYKGTLGWALKIGYTSKWEGKRETNYKSHNPGAIKLQTLKGGKEEQEKRLHQWWRKYRLEGMREWYYLAQEILEWFEEAKENYSLLCKLPLRGKDFNRGESFYVCDFLYEWRDGYKEIKRNLLKYVKEGEYKELEGKEEYNSWLKTLPDRYSTIIGWLGLEKIKSLKYLPEKIMLALREIAN